MWPNTRRQRSRDHARREYLHRACDRSGSAAPSRLAYRRGGWLYVVDDEGAVTIVNVVSRPCNPGCGACAATRHEMVAPLAGQAYPVMSLAAWTWSCLRPYRGRVAILTTIAVTNVALGVLAPWPLKLVVDNVLEGPAAARCPRSHWRRAGRRQPRGAARAGRVRRTAAAGPDADALDDQRAGAGRHRAAARLRAARAAAGASAGAGAAPPRRHPYGRFGLPPGSRRLLRARPGHERVAQPVRVSADAGGDVRRPAAPGCLARAAVAGGRPVAVRLSALLLDQDGGPRAAA